MKEINEYIEILEDRHKAYIKLIEMLIDSISELEERIEKIENK